MTDSRSIHLTTNNSISFLFMAENKDADVENGLEDTAGWGG